MLRNWASWIERSTRSMRSIYLIKLELLLDPRIRVGQVNSFELKFNSSITLVSQYILQFSLNIK